MAISENTPPASAGKANEAERLISETLATIANAYSGLRQIESWPDKSQLADELSLLQSIANYVSDANCTIDAVLEDLIELSE